MPTTLDELIIKGGKVAIKLDKSGNNVYLSNIKGSIADLDVDPLNLKEHTAKRTRNISHRDSVSTRETCVQYIIDP